MSRYFLDTNIIADYIFGRDVEKTRIRELIEKTPLENLYISSLTVHIIFYLAKVKYNTDDYFSLRNILSNLNIIPLSETIIKKALHSPYNDFEDLLQFLSATEACDVIFTNDIKDFNKLKKLLGVDINIISKYNHGK